MGSIDFKNLQAVLTGDGTYSLNHPEHGELFHSFSGAALEARDLYIGSSSIQAAWQRGAQTHILDVGLGLGYNAMATLSSFLEAQQGGLHLVSLELERQLVELLRTGTAEWQLGWPESWVDIVRSLTPVSDSKYEADGENWRWEVHCGDALQINLAGTFDYIWQDPFSPSKNPSMWSTEWFAKLYPVSHLKTELLSYSVSRPVKNALTSAGWEFVRIPTTTAKRHWLKASPKRT